MRFTWIAAMLVACDETPSTDVPAEITPPAEEGPCEDRVGGALVTLDVAGEGLVVWITNDAFVDVALERIGQPPSQVINFTELRHGTDCDGRYSWHVAPHAVELADFAAEVCDGRPSNVEDDPSYWIDELGQFCPWSAAVVAVSDQR
ncbi:MAG: hypothetical protein KTR31_36365 [Myxococcales bacterium]|nr:hypothetical protein [Myxococcales bacterium]